MQQSEARWSDAALTLLIGLGGAAIFWLVSFPMPFLTGPATAVSVAALFGVSVGIPTTLRNMCFLLIGLNIGASVTPEVIATAGQWPVSLLLLAVLLVVSLKICTWVLVRGFGFGKSAAFLAATPGHLSYVLSLSADRNLPLESIAIVQSIRVLLLSILVPLALVLVGFELEVIPLAETQMSLLHLGILLVLGFLLGLVFMRLQVPAALLLSAMAVSAIGHGSGLTPGAPTPIMTIGAFIVMGGLIGSRFSGTTPAELKRYAVAGASVTAIASVIMLIGAVVLGMMTGLDPLLLFVAYAPGGVETMAAISVQLDLAAAVVAAHHVARLLLLSVLVPILMPKD